MIYAVLCNYRRSTRVRDQKRLLARLAERIGTPPIDAWLRVPSMAHLPADSLAQDPIIKPLQPGDTVLCADLNFLGRTYADTLARITAICERGCSLRTVHGTFHGAAKSAEAAARIATLREAERVYRAMRNVSTNRKRDEKTWVEKVAKQKAVLALMPRKQAILDALQQDKTAAAIAREYNVNYITMLGFIKNYLPDIQLRRRGRLPKPRE